MARKYTDESDWMDNMSLAPEFRVNACEYCNGLGLIEVYRYAMDRKGEERNGSRTCPDCFGTGVSQ